MRNFSWKHLLLKKFAEYKSSISQISQEFLRKNNSRKEYEYVPQVIKLDSIQELLLSLCFIHNLNGIEFFLGKSLLTFLRILSNIKTENLTKTN